MNYIFKRELESWTPQEVWIRTKYVGVSLFSRWLGFRWYLKCKYDGEPYSIIFLGFLRLSWGWEGHWEYNSTGWFLDDVEYRNEKKNG